MSMGRGAGCAGWALAQRTRLPGRAAHGAIDHSCGLTGRQRLEHEPQHGGAQWVVERFELSFDEPPEQCAPLLAAGWQHGDGWWWRRQRPVAGQVDELGVDRFGFGGVTVRESL